MRLTDFDLPPLRVVRPTQVVQVFYGFGDASGKQFGATLSENYNCRGRLSGAGHGPDRIRFRIGLWSPEVEEESSNYKELRNLVDTVGEEARASQLRDCELFVFTDNSTAEGCFHRGTSKSVHLHSLVLELRTLERRSKENISALESRHSLEINRLKHMNKYDKNSKKEEISPAYCS